MMPKPFLDISVESDRKTKLHVLFNFQEDNKWELKVDRVPGQKMTIEVTVNGQKWTGVGNLNQGEMKLNLKMDSEFSGKHFNVDFDLNPSGMWGLHVTGDIDGPVDIKWTMQRDFTMGEISMKYKNQNYAFMQLKGNAEMRGMIPVMFDYVVKYNIQDAEQQQGKAKLKFDARTPAKRFEINYAPKTGTPFEYVFDFDLSSGFKYDSDLKMNGQVVEKATGSLVSWHPCLRAPHRRSSLLEQEDNARPGVPGHPQRPPLRPLPSVHHGQRLRGDPELLPSFPEPTPTAAHPPKVPLVLHDRLATSGGEEAAPTFRP